MRLDESQGCAFCRGGEPIGTYLTGRVPATPGFSRVLRVEVRFSCAGTEMYAHDDWHISFCPICGRRLAR